MVIHPSLRGKSIRQLREMATLKGVVWTETDSATILGVKLQNALRGIK